MLLKIVSTHKGHFPLCFFNGVLYSRCGTSIYKWNNLEASPQLDDRLNLPILHRVASSIRPLERLLRLGLSHLAFSTSGANLAILNKRVFWKPSEERVWKEIGSLTHVSRPLRFGVCSLDNGQFLIGEYFSNPHRKEVSLWQVLVNGSMEVVYKFPNHTIQHIHAVQEDPFTNQIWVTTGDNDSECKVLTSADGCITFSLIGQGDQSWRTTCMLFSEDAVLWGMDSPGEPSFIIRWDRSSKEREFVTELPGPIWHGTSNADGWYTFSTAVEPGYLKEPQAYLWTSPNGFDFYKVAAYDKDFWPWTFFQFGLIYFPIGIAPANYLVFSGNVLKQYENTMVIARLVS